MTRSWVVRVAGLLALTAAFGTAAVRSTPDGGTAIGIWPAGLATGCLLFAPRRRVGWVLLLVGGVAGLSIWAGGRPLGAAICLALGISAGTFVMWRIFTGGRGGRPALMTLEDLIRFVVASSVSALAVGLAASATSVVSSLGDPLALAVAACAASLASQLTVVPFFARLRTRVPTAPGWERVAQWISMLVLTTLAFLPQDSPALGFVLIPILGWAALRNGAYEVLAQMVMVLGIAIALTTLGRGPFPGIVRAYGMLPEAQAVLLASFVIACALIVLPLMITVGEQLESASQAAAERDRVRSIVDGATGVAIIGTDERGIVTLFNPGAVRLLGYEPGEMLGRSTRILHSEQAIAEKAAELGVANDFAAVGHALVDAGPTVVRFVRKDGEDRSHSMSLNRVADDRGTVTGYVSTSEDITERVRAEQQVLEALEAERRAVDQLRQVDQVKDAFVSSVSHELRTPITSILGYIEMLQDGSYGPLTAGQLEAVRRVAGNSARLLSLIDDLLTLSRIQEDGLALVDRLVDLRRIVGAAHDVVVPMAERRDLAVGVDLPEDPVPFLGDRDMLERVVINLLSNAVKFTPDGGRVDVALRVDAEESVLEVADTGMGIPPEEQDRLFSRFFRSTLAQRQAIPGSGLGLSIANAIVERHGGRLTVDSEPGRGTTFRVLLPVLARAGD